MDLRLSSFIPLPPECWDSRWDIYKTCARPRVFPGHMGIPLVETRAEGQFGVACMEWKLISPALYFILELFRISALRQSLVGIII